MRTVTFPTTFASACYVVQSNMQSTGDNSADGHERNPTDVTRTSFKVYYNTPVSFIAVGKQQWGYSIANGGTFTYPLSLNTVYGYFTQLNATSSVEKALFKEISPSSVSTTKLVMNTNTSSIKSNIFIIGK